MSCDSFRKWEKCIRPMHLTEVHTIFCILLSRFIPHNVFYQDRGNPDRLLNKSIKQFASRFGSSTIEAESKFIQIIVQMRYLNGSLMSSQQPSFQQRNNSIGQRQKIFTNIRCLADNLMSITQLTQLLISIPIVCMDYGIRFNAFLYSIVQTFCGSISHSLKADSSNSFAILLCHNDYQDFTCSSTSPFPWLWPSNISFINLHRARETITARSHHSTTQLVQPYPSSPITAQSQSTLHTKSTNSMFLISHIPHCSKPYHQRLTRILKNCARRYRSFISTVCAVIQILDSLPTLLILTPRTLKAIRPAQLKQILPASFFRSKLMFKFHKIPWVNSHTHVHYILEELQSSA